MPSLLPPPRIVVSACLAGIPCRFDGRHNLHQPVADLVRRGLAIPACPESLADLPIPRAPCEWRDGRVVSRDGADITEAFQLGARRALEIALRSGCDRAILKAKSPSCGVGRIHDGTFSGTLRDGDGLWAALLRRHGLILLTEKDALPEDWARFPAC